MDAVRIIEDEVRELIRRRGLDPSRQSGEVLSLVEAAVSDYDERSVVGTLPQLGQLDVARKQVFDAVAGFGALQPLLDDPTVEEVWINSPSEIYVARFGESELTSLVLTEQQIHDLVERMLKSSGRRLDLSSPFVDAALPDGSRLHVVIADVTRRHWSVNIRKFIAKATRLDHLVELGTLTPQAARFLDAAVASGLNILVSGATQAGKTTLLNCLGSSIGSRERVVTVEEIFELKLPLRDVVGMQCRPPNLEGQGEIPLRRLVKEALRMRPDRLIVGEVREAESLDMLVALNSGLPGTGSNAIQDRVPVWNVLQLSTPVFQRIGRARDLGSSARRKTVARSQKRAGTRCMRCSLTMTSAPTRARSARGIADCWKRWPVAASESCSRGTRTGSTAVR